MINFVADIEVLSISGCYGGGWILVMKIDGGSVSTGVPDCGLATFE